MKISFNKKTNHDTQNGVKIEYAPAKRKISRLSWWLILALVFSPFVFFLLSLGKDWLFLTSPGYLTMENYTVTAPVAGTISQIYVKQGDTIKAGEPLLEIQPPAAEGDKAELIRAEAELTSLPGLTEQALPKGSLKAQKAIIASLEKEERTFRSLMEKGAATRAEYNQIKEKLLLARLDMEKALSVPAPPKDTSEQTRAAFLKEYITRIKKRLTETTVVAAARDGQIENISAPVGSGIRAGDQLMRITTTAQPYVVTYIYPENYGGDAVPGKTVRIIMPGSGRKIMATVAERPLNADNVPGGLADSILAGRRGIVVFLKPQERLLSEEYINGMPVHVDWGFRFLR